MGLQKLDDANSLRSFIIKICAYLPKISNFGYNARSVPVNLGHSIFFPSVFTPIHILFKGLQKFFEKKTFFRYITICEACQGVRGNHPSPKQHVVTFTCQLKEKIYRPNPVNFQASKEIVKVHPSPWRHIVTFICQLK